MLEVEVKLRVDPEQTISGLEKMGFEKGTTVYEYDVYYNSGYLDLKKADKALRIREHRDFDTGVTKYILNYKGARIDAKTMTREETQFEVPSRAQGETVINGLGFFAAGTVEKTRIHYRKGKITCCLDRVTGLGDYLEIEIMAEDLEEYTQALKTIEQVLSQLGLDMEMTVNASYLSLLQGDH